MNLRRRSGGQRGRLTTLLVVALMALGAATTAIGAYSSFVYLTQPAVAIQRAWPGGPTATAPAVPPPPALLVPWPAASASPPPAAVQNPAERHGTWLEIPDLGIYLPVDVGVLDVPVPDWKALLYPGTAWPGQPGNSYLYAHGIWGEFGALLWARVGQPVEVHNYDTGKVTVFHVSRVIGKVAGNDTSWLEASSPRPLLTMQTCTSDDPHGPIWIVQAR